MTEKLFGRKLNFQNYRNYVGSYGYKRLLVYIAHHCYPINGVQERVKYCCKYST